MKKLKLFRIVCVVMCLLCCVLSLQHVQAEETPEAGSLLLKYSQNGAVFSAYRVAEMTREGYVLTGNFAGYPVTPAADTTEQWLALAATLAAYAARDGIAPDASGEIDHNMLTCTGLLPGLYLVVGSITTQEQTVYHPIPFLVALEAGEDCTASVKWEEEILPGPHSDYTVQKVWQDTGFEEKRPDSVTVQLLENGKVMETVTLSEENDWQYTWEQLPDACQWQVTEQDVPGDYTVTISQSGKTFTVTNTYQQTPATEPTGTEKPAKPGGPDTGDDRQLLLYTVLSGISLCVLVLLLLTRSKEKRMDRGTGANHD